MKDRDRIFHEKWLGYAEPIEGLVFSVPVLADAQIAPDEHRELSVAFEAQLDPESPGIRSVESFFRDFLGYSQPGMLVRGAELPPDVSFYAAEGGQEIRPTFALGRGPFASDDAFATFDTPKAEEPKLAETKPWFALIWDVGDVDLDEPEATTGPWRYPPTAKFERLLRHVGIPIGFLVNGKNLRLVYAPTGESTGHLTFRVEHMRGADGRTLLTALDLLLHTRRAYGASPAHTLEGLLAESRKRQADVTEALAKQVFEAVELLVAGLEAAASRDIDEGRHDWLRGALEAEDDHFYQGVLSVVLRMVFLLYAEDESLLPVEHPTYEKHLSLGGLYERLAHDAGAHPESMHHRFGAYGQLLSLFRSVFFGVRHGSLVLPPRSGRLFDPNAYPFLEGGLPGWTSAVVDPVERARVEPPSVDDGTIHQVLHRLVVFHGQRLSYRALDVEQIGSVYESLMGYHVLRVTSPAVRVGKLGVWVECEPLRSMKPAERARFLKDTCALSTAQITSLEKSMAGAKTDDELVAALHGNDNVPVGRLVLQPGEERRRTGTHYTPRSLTEKIVKRALEPLLTCLGESRTPEQILQLKICDPAMGSGAFLVAVCRELAGEMVAAWTRAGQLAKVIEEHGDAHLHARRLVAQQCLYGVDRNVAAVELAKLSLWLVTLSKTLPFTFVDHALRHGDSLVGLDFKQIESFHWAPTKQTETCRVLLREALDEAVDLRQQILALAERDDLVSQGEKRRLFDFAQQAIDRVRIVADVCVGAFFAEGKNAAREEERERRLALIERWLAGDAEAGVELEQLAYEVRKQLAPFHWWIELPEVFFDERPDPLQGGAVNGAALMDAFVGNPPFAGKNGIAAIHPGYLPWLQSVHEHAHGNADLSAHFFRRASVLLGVHGTMGLIATNTIAQGDTRATGLQHLVTKDGCLIYDAVKSMEWPTGDASVSVSVVHIAKGAAAKAITRLVLDDRPVTVIDSRLRPKPERPDPVVLRENADLSFQGSIVLGMGFTLTPAERDALVAKDPRNAERMFPYLGGEEVNTSPTQMFDRYVINFGQMPLDPEPGAKEWARKWPDLIDIVERLVKPERDKLADNPDGRRRRHYWWQFGRVTPALEAALAKLPSKRCLVTARVSKHLMFAFQRTDRVMSEQLYVFTLEGHAAFAVLQSRAHEPWAWLLSSSMRNAGIRYAATDCFETFPFPQPDPRTVIPPLADIGQRLDTARAAYMVATQQGLTKTYNALKAPASDDPRILELRRLHEEMDRAVLDAYSWTDLVVPPFCAKDDKSRSAVAAFEDEVIDRLFALNAKRAAPKLRPKVTPKGAHADEKRGRKSAKKGQGELF